MASSSRCSGPSGCGKTTTLRCIAGLETPTGGSIAINGETVSDPATNLFVPPHERDLGMVFQSYAVWPHLTVAENVAFPLTVKGERDVAASVNWALDIVGMGKLAKRRPSELSGGQQQRVALARAIAARPQLLLFDEPLSNLDARLRDRTRLEISRIQRELKVPALYVTHDQTEALSMSDRVIVMDAGRIVQEGDAARAVPAAGQSLRRRFHRQRQFPACAARRTRVAAGERFAGRGRSGDRP